MSTEWWEGFFDSEYLKLWKQFAPEERSQQEADGLWEVLQLTESSRVLDAPCGYGRLSLRLARKGADVVGLDWSEDLLADARQAAHTEPPLALQYFRHDLRRPIPEELGLFDAAINIFSSLGYGSEADDLAILANLRAALRPAGLAFIETNHRDAAVVYLSRGDRLATRLSDGTLIVEEPKLDQIQGRIETRWYWSGPEGHGVKEASFRVYTPTELIGLIERAGLSFVSAHKSCSKEPFEFSPLNMGGRIGLLARRP